jgi:2,3-bisphosphoglycerate-dependent phosphoglycerate mutase
MAKASPELSLVPKISSWRLNERHYGALVGLSKEEAGRKLGQEKVMEWRRSWDQAPPKMEHEDFMDWRLAPWARPVTIISHPGKKNIVTREKGVTKPKTESLADCANRVLPLWVLGIAPRVARGETVLVVAHANSIRSMIRHIDTGRWWFTLFIRIRIR